MWSPSSVCLNVEPSLSQFTSIMLKVLSHWFLNLFGWITNSLTIFFKSLALHFDKMTSDMLTGFVPGYTVLYDKQHGQYACLLHNFSDPEFYSKSETSASCGEWITAAHVSACNQKRIIINLVWPAENPSLEMITRHFGRITQNYSCFLPAERVRFYWIRCTANEIPPASVKWETERTRRSLPKQTRNKAEKI